MENKVLDIKRKMRQLNIETHYVKVYNGRINEWLEVEGYDFLKKDKKTILEFKGKSLKTGKEITFSASDVIAYYTGNLKIFEGLGMPYVPTADVCVILDTIVPDSMGYETHIACRVVQQIIGKPIHEFVAGKLHYTEIELCKALSAEQVDAVALAIYNIEYKNQGMIIGDQTGIGKGRVAAAMIRYGCYNKLKPIFLSEKPNLFTDIYRDLCDIGSQKLVPFIVNGREAKTDIKDNDGNIVHQALPKTEQDKIFNDLKFPAGYDFVCATYTQFNSVKEKPTKPNFLRAIAQNNLVIMDEAHNASGSSNTGEFLQEVLIGAKGVVFLSATFAKRPDNMPIYALKTCISEANMSKDDLINAISQGGVALQEVLSSQLVAEGQMIRRERSFEGVEVNYITLTEKEIEHKATFDNITEVLRDIIVFQSKYISEVVKKLDKIAAAEGKEVEERKGTSKAGVDNTPYFSKVFQVINQILFSLKSRSVAELAIERLNQGLKPIIAFSSTMESFIDDMQEAGRPVTVGDTINIDFKTVLSKGLEGVMKYTITDVTGNNIYKYFEVSELDFEAQQAYYDIIEKINRISTGISISPIDVIKDIIRKAGYTCDEVTGRKYEIQMVEGKDNYGVLLNRKKILANDAFRMFNNNELDCLMINQSGSTGASAHAIVTKKVPKEAVKQRVMLILQPELDINREVQKRGRINRTGQILKPIYDYVTSCIPAEQRLMMMLRKKLKSLDANTTSNQKQSDNILQVDDFLNKYGDKVVTDYLIENSDLNEILGDPLELDKENKTGAVIDNAASKVSGRVAVLSVPEQEKFYVDILERYNDYVNYLRQCDKYDLEVETLNLEAETLETKIIIEGKNGNSVFSENTNLETCEVNALKKPFTKDELKNIVNEALKSGTAIEQQQKAIEDVTEYYTNKLALDIDDIHKKYDKHINAIWSEPKCQKLSTQAEKQEYFEQRKKALENARLESIDLEKQTSENKLNNILKFFKFFYIGKALNYPTFFNQSVKAVCLGYHIDYKKKNPFAPSALKIKIAIANSDKYIDLTLSGEAGSFLLTIMGNSTFIQKSEQEQVLDNWDYYTRNSNANRKKAFIVTGNILQAYSQFSGKLISFTTKDGSTRKGILLPENFDPQKNAKQGFISVLIGKAVNYVLQMSSGEKIYSADSKIIIEKYHGYSDKDYVMYVPANKNYQDYFKDKEIIGLCLNIRDGFEKRSGQMVAYFSKNKISKLLTYISDKYNLSVSVSQSVYDAYFEKKNIVKVKSDLIEKAEKIYEIDKNKFEQRKNVDLKQPTNNSSKISKVKIKLKIKAKALELLKL